MRILGSSSPICRAQTRVVTPYVWDLGSQDPLLGKGQHVLKGTLLSTLGTPHSGCFFFFLIIFLVKQLPGWPLSGPRPGRDFILFSPLPQWAQPVGEAEGQTRARKTWVQVLALPRDLQYRSLPHFVE